MKTRTTTTTMDGEMEEGERHQKLGPQIGANSMSATACTGTTATATPAMTPPTPAALLLMPPPPPTLMYARIILGEATPLLAAIKRTGAQRWSSHSLGDVSEHLTASLERLQGRLLSLEPLEPPLPPLEFLEPFLSVIKAEDTSGPITRDALCSVDRMIGYGLLNPRDSSAGSLRESAAAAEAVAAAVSRARFIGTESASDEVVLFSIVHVLSALVLSSAGPLLSNGAVCEILNSAFRICFENRLSDLLRACTEEALRQMVTLIFTRLPFYPPHDPPSGPPAPPRPPKVKLRSPHPSAKFDLDVTSTAARAGMQSADTECETERSLENFASASVEKAPGTGTGDLGLDIELGANEDDVAAVLSDTGAQDTPPSGQKGAKDIFINSQGVTFTTVPNRYGTDPALQPFGVPCLRELLRFLITLTTPLNAQNTTKMIETALHLLTVALEIGGHTIGTLPGLMALLSDHLCKNLLQLLSYLDTHRSYGVYITSLRLYILLCENFKTRLKYQLETFHNQLISLITADRPAVTYTHKEYAIMAILRLWSERDFTRELYLNFDCDLFAANCLEEAVKSLSKQVFPLDGVYGNNLLCLDALLRLMEALDASRPALDQFPGEISRSENAIRAPDQQMGEISRSGHVIRTPDRGGWSYVAPVLVTRPVVMQHTHTDAHELLRRKKQKDIIAVATDLFNNKPEKGILYLYDHGVLGQQRGCPNNPTDQVTAPGDATSSETGQIRSKKGQDAHEIAQFLRQNHKLCKKSLGNYLSAKKNLDILNAFVATFDFKDVRIDEALRNFLEAFRLPGEAPLISLVLETFAAHWFNANIDRQASPAEPQCVELAAKPVEQQCVELARPVEQCVELARPVEQQYVELARPVEEQCVELARPTEQQYVELATRSAEPQCVELVSEPKASSQEAQSLELAPEPKEPHYSELGPEPKASSQEAQSSELVPDTQTTSPEPHHPELHHSITMEGPSFTEPKTSGSFHSDTGSRLAGVTSSNPALDVAVQINSSAREGANGVCGTTIGTILGPTSYGTAPSIGTILGDHPSRADGTENAGYGTENAGYGTENAVYGTENAGYGTENAVYGTENAGYGTENAVYGTDNAAYGTGRAFYGTGSADDGTVNAIGTTEGDPIERDGTNNANSTMDRYPGSVHVGGLRDTPTEPIDPQDAPVGRPDPTGGELSDVKDTPDRPEGSKDTPVDRPLGTTRIRPEDTPTSIIDGVTMSRPPVEDPSTGRGQDTPIDGVTMSKPLIEDGPSTSRPHDTPIDGVTMSRPPVEDGPSTGRPHDTPTDGVTISRPPVEEDPSTGRPHDTPIDGVTMSKPLVEDGPSTIRPQDTPSQMSSPASSSIDGVTVSKPQVQDGPSAIRPQDTPSEMSSPASSSTDGVTVSKPPVQDGPSAIRPQDTPIDGVTVSKPQVQDGPSAIRPQDTPSQMSSPGTSSKEVVRDAPRCGVRSSDAAFTLAYAIIMLNVDQHNKNAKKQNIPMTVEQFTANLRGVNDGAHFPRDMLAQIYEAVRSEELVMPSEQQGAVKDEYLWKLLLKRGQSEDGVYVLAEDFTQVDREIFLTAWGPTVAALSYVYDKSGSEDTILTALGGYRKIASIAFKFNMADVFDNLIVTLCKFTTLNYTAGGDVEAIAATFTASTKGRLAAKCVFDLAVQYGDAIREGWRNILDILVRLFQLRLLPDGLTQGYDFVAADSKVCLLPEQPTQQPIRSENSLLSSLYSYIAMGDAHSRSSAHTTESVSCARVCVRECNIERLVHESVYLRTHTLIELTRTLLTNAYTDDVHAHTRTHAHAFLLELCVRILTANKDRVHTIWPHVRKNVYTAFLCAQREPRVYLLERTCVCVLRCTQILLRKPADGWVLTVQWLLSVNPNKMPKVAKQILLGLKEILTANSVHIQPEEWDLIFSLVEYAGGGALPPTFPTNHSAEDEGGESDGTVDSGVGSDDQPQPSLPDGRLNAALPADSSGGWILVGREGEVEGMPTTVPNATGATTTTPAGTPYTLAPTTAPQLPHKPQNLLVAVVTLSFLAKECANAPNIKTATTANVLALGSATRATRVLVEAALHGGLINHQLSERKTNYQKKKKKKKRKTATKAYHSEEEEEEEEESGSCGDGSDGNGTSANANNNTQLIYQQVSEKLLDLMGCLHTSASQLSTYYQNSTTTTTTPTVDLWNIALCPLLQGIARFCCDSRGSVRSLALTTLQRALLTHDLVVLSASKWEQLFHRVLFPLLSGLIDLPSLALPQQHQQQHLEEARLRAATLVMKVYLRHLSPLLTLPTFTALWLTILDFYEKYLSLSSDHLVEAIPELLKNMLLVMKTTQAFQTPQGLTQLWAITWDKIDSFLPSLRHNIFRSHPPSEIPSLEAKPEREEDPGFVPPTLREQDAARLSLSQENLPEIIENSSVILQPPLPAAQLASPISQSEASFPERGRSQPMTSQSAVPIILKGLPVFTDKN